MSADSSNTAELIIFDLDGTLVDSRRDIAASINEGLSRVAGITRPEEEIFPLIGRPLDHMYEVLLPEGETARAPEASAVYREHFFHNCDVHSRVFPGVFECLEKLGDKRLAIATTKATFQAVRVSDVMGLSGFFELVHGSDEIPHKPDPAVVLQVLERLDVPPGRAWMVGDTILDVGAGRAAGLRTCAVTYGIGAREDLERADPDLVVDSIDELPGRIF